ncbi:MAG TPA: ABC transporter substrate-binding protein [Polyangiaceae bacterium]|jgi:phospholipid transport system substrate-binding protein|nr:ABC transporter substrate-binding protein [Polyangiaceae bacterium]
MRHFQKFARVGLIALALAVATPAMADDSAQSFMKERQAELVTLIHKGGGPDNQKKIEQTFDAILDYDALAMGSLDTQWQSLNDNDKKEFEDTLKKLVQRAYRKNLDRTASYDVSFDGESKQAADATLVKTTAKSRTNAREEPISIDYLVHKPAAAWKVEDIITEGSSLIKNYRQQFTRIIKKDGFPELLRRMKTKLANGSV